MGGQTGGVGPNLVVKEHVPLGLDVEVDAVVGAGLEDVVDQDDGEHDVRENRRHVHSNESHLALCET